MLAGGVLDKKSREVQFVNQYFVHTYCTIIYQLLPPVPELIRLGLAEYYLEFVHLNNFKTTSTNNSLEPLQRFIEPQVQIFS